MHWIFPWDVCCTELQGPPEIVSYLDSDEAWNSVQLPHRFQEVYECEENEAGITKRLPVQMCTEESCKPDSNVFIKKPSTRSRQQVECPYCQKKCEGPQYLDIHVHHKHAGKKFVFAKENCGLAYSSYTHLLRHQKIKHTKKEHLCRVKGCGKKFMYLYELQQHHGVHESGSTFDCDHMGCGKKFTTKP